MGNKRKFLIAALLVVAGNVVQGEDVSKTTWVKKETVVNNKDINIIKNVAAYGVTVGISVKNPNDSNKREETPYSGNLIFEENVKIEITAKNGIGVNLKKDSDNQAGTTLAPKKDYILPQFTNSGIIKANALDTKAVQISGVIAKVENKNIIEANKGGIGIFYSGTAIEENKNSDTNKAEFLNGKDGIIAVTGKDTTNNKITASKGIYLNGVGLATNEGTILVGAKLKEDSGEIDTQESYVGAEGVVVNNDKAEFKNTTGKIDIYGDSKGIVVYKGKAENTGVINAVGKNTAAVYVHGSTGEFINKKDGDKSGNITASGSGAKGIFFGANGGTAKNNGVIEVYDGASGVFFYKDSKNNFTNEKDGTIKVNGEKSVGLLLNAQGNTVNEGTINVESGKGVVLGGTTFTNSGKINAGINGIAIESTKDKNNTLILKNDGNFGITGKIAGNTGIDVLAVYGGSEYSDLAVEGYDKLISLKSDSSNDDAVISNSNIGLGFNSETDNYIKDQDTLNGDKTGLTVKNSTLVVDLSNYNENSSSLIDTGDGNLTLDGNMKVAFNSANGEKEFNISEILGDDIKITGDTKFESSAMWDYTTDANGNLIAHMKSYSDTVGKSQLSDFGDVLSKNEGIGGDFGKGLTLLGTLDQAAFSDAMVQLSGGIHGYTADMAAINSRTLSGIIKDRELKKDNTRKNPISSYDTDVIYINNKHEIGGLMDVDYEENGVIAVNEKQLINDGRLGLIVGGTKGDVDFEGGKHGSAKMDNLYLGGYYAHDFSDKLTLVSNVNFVYSHDKVKRNIKFAKDSQFLDYTYESTYPVFGFGGGATLYYTAYNKDNNKAVLYGGIDWTKIVQGNINENPDKAEEKGGENLVVKNIPADEYMYDSVVPQVGIALQHNGYIFDRKYRLGADVSYETELGNIKDGKRLKLSALSYKDTYRVGTTERENIVSYSLNGALDLTENFTVYADYTKATSDEYDAEKFGAGFEYKMDRMSDVFAVGPLIGNIENTRPHSNRWTGVFSMMLESEDDTNRSYYTEPVMGAEHSSGDYATSVKLKPKMTLSLRDRETNWSYYFETYYMSNGMGLDLDKNERRKSESRIHAEARWTDQYSKGKYGFNIGYRNETTSSPTLSQYSMSDRVERGLHQFRFTPNFTYNLGNGFVFGGSTTAIVAYDYRGYRKGQTDFELENEWGITYNGLMPRWRFTLNYFREETWYDGDFTKPGRVRIGNEYVKQDIEGERRYQSNQLRPRVTYFFGNGGRVEFSARIPIGNGYWYNSDNGNTKTAEKYETRYGVKYYQPITPGLIGFVGGEILTIKTKTTSGNDYGKETRDYSIRPTVGFSYNF